MAAQTQRITFLRHGQSKGNVAKSLGIDRRDEQLRDCGLTKMGAKQAVSVGERMCEVPELIVVSQLTRALATALLLKSGAPMISHPAVREIGGKIPENRTRPVAFGVSALRRDRALAELPGFDDVDFALVEGNDATLNLQTFADWLRRRPERRIWVVAHNNTIAWLLRDTLKGSSIPNCVPIATTLGAEGFMLVPGTRGAET